MTQGLLYNPVSLVIFVRRDRTLQRGECTEWPTPHSKRMTCEIVAVPESCQSRVLRWFERPLNARETTILNMPEHVIFEAVVHADTVSVFNESGVVG